MKSQKKRLHVLCLHCYNESLGKPSEPCSKCGGKNNRVLVNENTNEVVIKANYEDTPSAIRFKGLMTERTSFSFKVGGSIESGGRKRPKYEAKVEFGVNADGKKYVRTVAADRTKKEYREFVESDTGELMLEKIHPLREHRDRGSAKPGRKRRNGNGR